MDDGPTDDRPTDDGPSPVVVVTPRADGPILVDGPVTFTAADGTTSTEDRLFLCRCGASATKPLCDGSHKRTGFTAPGVAPTSRSADRDARRPDRPRRQPEPDDQPS